MSHEQLEEAPVVCYNSQSLAIENQLNIDNIILSRWNTAMKNGNFRFGYLEKLISEVGRVLIILVGTALSQLEKRPCQGNSDFWSSTSQIDPQIEEAHRP